MTTANVLVLVVAIVAELIAGALVSVEAALSRITPARAGEYVRQGRRGAKSLATIAADPARYVNSVLFVRIGVTVLAVVLAAYLVDEFVAAPTWSVLVATLIMVVVNFIVLGVAPRTLGQQHPATLGLAAAGPVRALSAVMAPLTKALILIGNAITPGKGFSEGPFVSEAEVRELLDRAEDVIAPAEQRMIASVFELGDTTCRELMVPRTDMVFVNLATSMGEALSISLRSGFSRLPVVGEDLDDVVGVITMKDIVRPIQADLTVTEHLVADYTRPATLVPDIKLADAQLRDFQASRTHLAVLIDEYGGTAGLVTVEDILEEIVGEISDESDVDEIPDLVVLGPDDFRVSARLPVDDLADFTELRVTSDSEGVDTVAGLFGRYLGVVPIPGSKVTIGDYRLTAETAEGRRNRISTVRVRKLASSEADEDADPRSEADPDGAV